MFKLSGIYTMTLIEITLIYVHKVHSLLLILHELVGITPYLPQSSTAF